MGKRKQDVEGKFVSKYHKTRCAELLAWMSEGQSVSYFCAKNSISRQTFVNWLAEYPEFKEAYDVALEKCESYWQTLADQYLVNYKDSPVLNTTLWSMNMRNRFGWSEHRRIKVDEFDTAMTTADKLNVISKHLAKGTVTPQESKALTDFMGLHHAVEQSQEMLKRIENLEALLSEKKEDERIG